MTDIALQLEDASFSKDGIEHFQGLSFSLEIGQGALLLTEPQMRARQLLRVCAALERPTQGRIHWFGRAGGKLTQSQVLDLRRRIGWVHRGSRLVSNMSLIDNMTLGLVYHRNLSYDQAAELVEDLMERFGLYHHRFQRPAEIDHAAQRRAVYVRELAKRPRLLLFEDPSWDLDQDFEVLMDEVKLLTQNHETAYLLSDVTAQDMVGWVDWVLLMDDRGNQTWPSDAFDPASHSRFSWRTRCADPDDIAEADG
jgi:ABC-type ATPase involved in cell division